LTRRTKSVDESRRRRRRQEHVRAHAAQRLAAAATPQQLAAQARLFLRLEAERLRIAARLGASGRQLAQARSFVLDTLVAHAYQTARAALTRETQTAPHACAAVAVGGYGRAEVAPHSDLDLLFVPAERADVRALVERTLHVLWDAGLTVGHRCQPARACLAAAQADAHLQTALVHARLVAGDPAPFAALREAHARQRRKRADALVEAARRARDERHLKHEAIIYLQEPNVKEGVGGLRDLHAALWAADARFECATLVELHARGVITADELTQVERAYDFLLRVRDALQRLTGRKTERLALDRQPALAAEFGYTDTPHLRASEQFMRDYYRRARTLYEFGETMLARAAAPAHAKTPARWLARPRRTQLAELFVIKERRLHLDGDAGRLAAQPLLGLEAVALAQAARVEFDHELRAAVVRHVGAVDRACRESAAAAELLLTILRRRGRVGAALRLMRETNLLGSFLPEFARIQMLIQHDLYHHYTVDEHTLRAVEALDELCRADATQRPVMRAALAEVEDVALLYLALLLHDLGKGRGRGHIERGVRIAERVCARLRLDAAAAAKVLNLVRQHVLMAHVSQRRDLRDPRTVADFAARLGGLDELNMLMLLTYADLHAVAPGVWSEWKGTLLQELYTRARTHCAGGARPLGLTDERARLKAAVAALVAGELPLSEVERHFALLPARYAEHLDATAAAAHLRLVAQLEQQPCACRWQTHASAHASELTIAARDRRGLFADLAGALAAHGVEILSADLHTRADAVALDTLMLREAATHAPVAEHRRPTVERALAAALVGRLDVAAAVERWRTRNAPRRPSAHAARAKVAPAVACSNEIAEATTVVEVRAADEPGLAYRIAAALAARGLDIRHARIATEKADALDVFYVTDADGKKLDEAAMRGVTEALRAALAPEVSSFTDDPAVGVRRA
jgi:[protein-PII] uridylyltransferase